MLKKSAFDKFFLGSWTGRSASLWVTQWHFMVMITWQRYADCSNCPDIAEDTFCSGAGDAAPCFGYMWGDAGWVVSCQEIILSCDDGDHCAGAPWCVEASWGEWSAGASGAGARVVSPDTPGSTLTSSPTPSGSGRHWSRRIIDRLCHCIGMHFNKCFYFHSLYSINCNWITTLLSKYIKWKINIIHLRNIIALSLNRCKPCEIMDVWCNPVTNT